MKTFTLILAAFALSLSVFSATKVTTASIDWPKFLAQHDMYWTSFLADATTYNDTQKNGYYSGCIMGNGLVGTNFYKLSTNVYRLSACRSDIVDPRSNARLPVGYFTLTMKGNVKAETMRLSLYDAIGKGTISTDQGKVGFKTYVHSQKNYIVFNTDAVGADTAFTWNFVPQKAINPRYVIYPTQIPAGFLDANNNEHPDAIIQKDGDYNLCIQQLLNKLNGSVVKVYVVAWKEQRNGLKRRIIATISQQSTQQAAIDSAKATIAQAFLTDDTAMENTHKAWWHNFYPNSFISFPVTKFESFYWAQLYKFASATRIDKPAVDLQGPWATYNTPWAMFWNNLNTQLTYSLQVKANQGDLTKSLWAALNANSANLHKNVSGVSWPDALILGTTSTYNFSASVNPTAMSFDAGDFTWLLYYYWQYCAGYADSTEMKTRFFPMLKDAVNLYFHIRTGKDANGKWNLPPTSSPEYRMGTNLGPNSNYDLSILRWGLKTLMAVNDTFHLNDSKRADWQDFSDNLIDFPVDKLGYMVSSDTSFTMSTHRHYSHLFMIYPFHQVSWDNPAQAAIMNTSMNNWTGTNGFSYTGRAGMLAGKGDGNGALTQMTTFMSTRVKPNTLYAETGPCIETPLAAASSLHEFYLQDWGDKIIVFPAMPTAWTDASYINLRAIGAFLISATRKSGKTVFIQVESEAGGLCRLQTGMTAANLIVKALDGTNVTYKLIDSAKGVIEVATKAGAVFQITDKTLTTVYPAPVTHLATEKNPFGLNSGPDPIEGVALSSQSVSLTESAPSVLLTASMLPSGVAKTQLNWVSSNENVVKVNNGLLMAVAPGDAVVIASSLSGYASDTCVVHVTGSKFSSFVPLPEDDSYVFDASASANLNFGNDALVTVRSDAAGNNRMGFFKFSLADMDKLTFPTDSAEVKVSLYVNSTGTAANAANWQFYRVDDNTWTENTMTWNNKPLVSTQLLATTTGFNNTTGTYNASNWLTLDISNYAWQQYISGKKLISFNATQSAKSTNGTTYFATKENLDNQQIPRITIRRVPKHLVSAVSSVVADDFRVYTLPIDHFIHVYAPSASNYSITDLRGRKILSGSVTAGETKTITVPQSKNSVYLVAVGEKIFKVILN